MILPREERLGFAQESTPSRLLELREPEPEPEDPKGARQQKLGGISRNEKAKAHDVNLSEERENKSKRKRSCRKENKVKEIMLNLLWNNIDGILNKLKPLDNNLKTENPGAIFLQDTKVGRTWRIRVPSNKTYSWYDLIRTQSADKGTKGGGLAIGVLNILDPS